MMMIEMGACYKFKDLRSVCLNTFIALVFSCLWGCNSVDSNQPQEDAKHGNIRISVDESFKPVIDSQIKVYQASFPDAHITAEYKPEAECLKDLSNDSVRMVIVT